MNFKIDPLILLRVFHKPQGLRVALNTYFSFLKYIRQLLLMTFCDTPAGIRVSVWTHTQDEMESQTDRRTDRRGS